MREAGVVSLNIRMVRECYQMMDLMEKQDFVFTQEDKRILLGYAFHQQDLDCVHDDRSDMMRSFISLRSGKRKNPRGTWRLGL